MTKMVNCKKCGEFLTNDPSGICDLCLTGITDLAAEESRAESAPRTGETAPAGEAARRSLSEPVELKSIITKMLSEARREQSLAHKKGRFLNSQYYHGQSAALAELLAIINGESREALKGNGALSNGGEAQ